MFRRWLLGNLAWAPDDGGAGGAAAPAPAAPAAGDVGAGAAAPAAPDAAASAAATLLSGATDPDAAPAAAGEVPADKPADGEPKADDKPADAPAPPDYTALSIPDGVTADLPAFESFKKTAGELGLTAEQAQALVNTVAPNIAQALQAPMRQWTELQESWIGEWKADKEIGGANFERNIGYAAKAIDKFGSPGLREVMAFTGVGNNPEFGRFMIRVGIALSEGSYVAGQPAGQQRSTAEKMYPSMGDNS